MTRIKLKVLLALGFALGALASGTSAAVLAQQQVQFDRYILPGDQVFPEGARLPGVHGRLRREQHPDGSILRGNVGRQEAEVFIPGGTDVLCQFPRHGGRRGASLYLRWTAGADVRVRYREQAAAGQGGLGTAQQLPERCEHRPRWQRLCHRLERARHLSGDGEFRRRGIHGALGGRWPYHLVHQRLQPGRDRCERRWALYYRGAGQRRQALPRGGGYESNLRSATGWQPAPDPAPTASGWMAPPSTPCATASAC